MEPEKQDQIVESVPQYKGWDKIKRFVKKYFREQPDFENVTDAVTYDPKIIEQYNQDLDSIPAKRRAVILSNIIHESRGITNAGGDVDDDGNVRAYGLLQWWPDRFNRAADDADDPDYQLRYMVGTMKQPKNNNWIRGGKHSGYRSANQVQRIFYNDNNSIKDINRALVWGYVRPKHQNTQAQQRTKTAEEIYRRIQAVEKKQNGGRFPDWMTEEQKLRIIKEY